VTFHYDWVTKEALSVQWFYKYQPHSLATRDSSAYTVHECLIMNGTLAWSSQK